MTDEEIDKLEAGPELDALVAEKIMGWQRIKFYGRPGHIEIKGEWSRQEEKSTHDILRSPDGQEFYLCCRPDWITSQEIPQYSTNMDTTWKVVEKMSAQDFECQVSMTSKLPNDDKERCYCHFEQGDDNAPWRPDYKLIQAWALTVPLAICRAALKAVNYDSSNS